MRSSSGLLLLGPVHLVSACDQAVVFALLPLLVELGKLIFKRDEDVSGDVTIANATGKPLTFDLGVTLRSLEAGDEDEDAYEIELAPGQTIKHRFGGLYSSRLGSHVIAARAAGEEAESECFSIGDQVYCAED